MTTQSSDDGEGDGSYRDLDPATIDQLIETVDEIDGTRLRGIPGDHWLHTTTQVRNWLYAVLGEAVEARKSARSDA